MDRLLADPGLHPLCDGDRLNGTNSSTIAIARYPTGAPVVSTPPTVAGTARAGSVLAGVPGTWSGGKPVTFTYQWQRCDAAGAGCVPIPGATLETYTPVAADVGHALVLSVAATTPSGTGGARLRPRSPSPRPEAAPRQAVGDRRAERLRRRAGGPDADDLRGLVDGRAHLVRVPVAALRRDRRRLRPDRERDTSSYTLTPDDIGATLSLVVTATGKGGSQSASAPTTAVVAEAPVPPAVTGSAAAQQGLAGAVVTDDARATVTWQPGAVPVDSTVSLAAADTKLALAGTGVSLDVEPPVTSLPWPVDIAYAAAPAGQVVGFSTDGRIWIPVAALTGTTLPAGLTQGTYLSGSTLHVLTKQAGRFALFAAGKWGDPTFVSAHAPVLRRLAAGEGHAATRPDAAAHGAAVRQLAGGPVRERVRPRRRETVVPAARLGARAAAARRRDEDRAHALPHARRPSPSGCASPPAGSRRARTRRSRSPRSTRGGGASSFGLGFVVPRP